MTENMAVDHAEKAGSWSPLLVTVGFAYLGLLIASSTQLLDPMVRHDDFPALLADPSGFYIKTLHEGRWLNYWWHLRGWASPAWLNFVVYQLFWATFAGAAAVNACGRTEQRWYTIVLALMIAVAPPAYLISLWFNTLIPGLGLVALFAVLATIIEPRKMRLLLLLFVPATLMAYTSYPLFLLAVCLTSRDARRSWRDLITLMAIFVFSFAMGIFLIYCLNYAEHGIFGIPMAEWRNPNPVRDMASLTTNLELVLDFLGKSAATIAFHFPPFIVAHGLLLIGGMLILARVDPWVTLYILTGLVAGICLLCLQIIMAGVTVPVRAITFAWVLYCVVCVRVALLARDRGGLWARMARNVLVLITASYMLQTAIQYLNFRDWQVQTRNLAAQTSYQSGPIYVIGSYLDLPAADKAGIQEARGLRLRLTYLTGRKVYVCEETPEACKTLPEEFFSGGTQHKPKVQDVQDRTIILLPRRL